MKKKLLSLALALTMCLGLTIPAFAVETWTETNHFEDGIDCNAYVDSSIGYVSYTGAGKLMGQHAELGAFTFDNALFYTKGGLKNLSTVSVSIGPGLTMTDEFKEVWNEIAGSYGFSVSFDGSSAPAQPQQPEQPQQPAGSATASPTNDKLEVNGAAADPTVYKIGGSNYFKIRDVAALLNGTEKQFAVGYDGALSSVTAATGQGYTKLDGDLAGAATGGDQTANLSNDTIYVDGQKVEAEVYKINGSNYFKLRDLGKALNFYVGWSAERGMYIETDKPYSE